MTLDTFTIATLHRFGVVFLHPLESVTEENPVGDAPIMAVDHLSQGGTGEGFVAIARSKMGGEIIGAWVAGRGAFEPFQSALVALVALRSLG